MRKWTLSEFLNLLEIRSQHWCSVELKEDTGFSVPYSDEVFFYAVTDGSVSFHGTRSEGLSLEPGDILMIISGEAHAIRTQQGIPTETLDYLSSGAPVDTPPAFVLGQGRQQARLLCGKLRVRWPFGQRPKIVPTVFKLPACESIINLSRLERLAYSSGGASVLTRTASLVITMAFQNESESEQVFIDFVTNNPIDCVKQYIERHPYQDWSVATLARRVGMARSTLAARFTAEVGKTPMKYMTIERMKLASKLLKQSDLKVSDISQRVGYRSEAAFSRRFTRHFGISPGKMRRKIQQAETAGINKPGSNGKSREGLDCGTATTLYSIPGADANGVVVQENLRGPNSQTF